MARRPRPQPSRSGARRSSPSTRAIARAGASSRGVGGHADAGPHAARHERPARRRRPGALARRQVGLRRAGRVARRCRSLVFLVSAQIQSEQGLGRGEERPRRAGYPLTSAQHRSSSSAPTAASGTKEPGANTSGASRSDSILLMRAGGGALGAPVDPARHGRRHPRPRAQQDQRRLRVRRPGARHPDGQALPRHRDQPRRRGRLRQLPRPHRRAGRRRLHGRLRRLAHQRRLSQRRLHAAAASAARPTSTASRRSPSPARARTTATSARTTSRARGASRSSSRR